MVHKELLPSEVLKLKTILISNLKYPVNGPVSQALALLVLFLVPMLLLLKEFIRAHCQLRHGQKDVSTTQNRFVPKKKYKSTKLPNYPYSQNVNNVQKHPVKNGEGNWYSVNHNYYLLQP